MKLIIQVFHVDAKQGLGNTFHHYVLCTCLISWNGSVEGRKLYKQKVFTVVNTLRMCFEEFYEIQCLCLIVNGENNIHFCLLILISSEGSALTTTLTTATTNYTNPNKYFIMSPGGLHKQVWNLPVEMG